MRSLMRNRFGIPGIISVIALVFAMAGGAYAAKKYVVEKKSQIKPSVLKELQGKPGAPGPAGAKGDTGAAGAKGDTGAAGAKGDTGAAGAAGLAGAPGPKGDEGEAGPQGLPGNPWTAGGTLPNKATETGSYAITSETGTGPLFGLAETAISFFIPLPKPIERSETIFVPQPGLSVPAECENTAHTGEAGVENPEADPGYLCVFQAGIPVNMEPGMEILRNGGLGEGASVAGATLAQDPKEAEPARGEGTWAVTACVGAVGTACPPFTP